MHSVGFFKKKMSWHNSNDYKCPNSGARYNRVYDSSGNRWVSPPHLCNCGRGTAWGNQDGGKCVDCVREKQYPRKRCEKCDKLTDPALLKNGVCTICVIKEKNEKK